MRHSGAAPAAPLFFAALGAAAAIPIFTRWGKACALLTLAGFMLCGASRLAFMEIGQAVPDDARADALYEGLVVESSPRVKVLSLSRPAALKGMRVAFPSGADLDVSQTVRVFGRIRPLVPSFKNPGSISWKWLKKLEGVGFEVRGQVLSAARSDDPIAAMRRYFKHNIESAGAPQADILKALTIGDRTAIPQEKNDLFLHTGTSHILAISGFNVGVISGFFFFIARAAFRRVRRFRLSGQDRRYAALVTIPFPFVFMLVAGAGVSVIRATIMITVFMLALFLQRKTHFYNTLALAACCHPPHLPPLASDPLVSAHLHEPPLHRHLHGEALARACKNEERDLALVVLDRARHRRGDARHRAHSPLLFLRHKPALSPPQPHHRAAHGRCRDRP